MFFCEFIKSITTFSNFSFLNEGSAFQLELWGERVNFTITGLDETTFPEDKNAMDEFDFTGYEELVYCGYGEPTCALDNLLASAAYAKEKYGIKVRLNTNGLANLYHGRNIVPELAKVVDSVSISLNAPTAEKYQKVTRPQFENAFPALLEFASLAQETFAHTQFSIVDVLPKEEIEACQKIADERGIYLKIRKFS